jgi:hypothetical protein
LAASAIVSAAKPGFHGRARQSRSAGRRLLRWGLHGPTVALSGIQDLGGNWFSTSDFPNTSQAFCSIYVLMRNSTVKRPSVLSTAIAPAAMLPVLFPRALSLSPARPGYRRLNHGRETGFVQTTLGPDGCRSNPRRHIPGLQRGSRVALVDAACRLVLAGTSFASPSDFPGGLTRSHF